jgi:hypothetical protein
MLVENTTQLLSMNKKGVLSRRKIGDKTCNLIRYRIKYYIKCRLKCYTMHHHSKCRPNRDYAERDPVKSFMEGITCVNLNKDSLRYREEQDFKY